jgi:hypothetical protein
MSATADQRYVQTPHATADTPVATIRFILSRAANSFTGQQQHILQKNGRQILEMHKDE